MGIPTFVGAGFGLRVGGIIDGWVGLWRGASAAGGRSPERRWAEPTMESGRSRSVRGYAHFVTAHSFVASGLVIDSSWSPVTGRHAR